MIELAKLLSVAVALSGKTDAEVRAALVKNPDEKDSSKLTLVDNFDNVLLGFEKSKILRLEEDHTTERQKFFDNGFKKGQSESLSGMERTLQTEYPDIKSDKKGIELIKEIVTGIAAKSSKLSESEIQKHPLYISLAQKAQADREEAKNAVQKEFDTFKQSIETDKVYSRIRNDFDTYIDSVKANEPTNPAIKKKFRDVIFESEIKNKYQFQVDENGNHLLLDKEGKPAKDEMGNLKFFKTIAPEIVNNNFEIPAQSHKPGTGADGKPLPPGAGGESSIKLPATRLEFDALIKQTTDPKETAKISAAFTEAKKKGLVNY